MKKTKWPGNWKVACHVCGMWYPSSEIKHRWDGLLVCHKDWEPKHPQLLIKIREETSFPDFVSEDAQPDQFVTYCDIITSSPYVGMGVVGCAQVGPYPYTYQFLLDLSTNGH